MPAGSREIGVNLAQMKPFVKIYYNFVCLSREKNISPAQAEMSSVRLNLHPAIFRQLPLIHNLKIGTRFYWFSAI